MPTKSPSTMANTNAAPRTCLRTRNLPVRPRMLTGHRHPRSPIFTHSRHKLPNRTLQVQIRLGAAHFSACGPTDDLGRVAGGETYREENMHRPPCPPIIDALDPRMLLSLTLAAAL